MSGKQETLSIKQAREARRKLSCVIVALDKFISSNGAICDIGAAMEPPKSGTTVRRQLKESFLPYARTVITPMELEQRIALVQSPGDRLLSMLLGYQSADEKDGAEKNVPVLFPEYDEPALWRMARERLSPREFSVIASYTGYQENDPIPVRVIAEKEKVSRTAIYDVISKAVKKLSNQTVLHNVFPSISREKDTVNAQIEQMKARIRDAAQKRIEQLSEIESCMQDADTRWTAMLEIAQSQRDRIQDIYGIMVAEQKQIQAALQGMTGLLVPLREARTEHGYVLPVRALNALQNAGITHLSQLANMDEREIRRIPNIGERCAYVIISAIRHHFGDDGGPDPQTVDEIGPAS